MITYGVTTTDLNTKYSFGVIGADPMTDYDTLYGFTYTKKELQEVANLLGDLIAYKDGSNKKIVVLKEVK